MLYLASRSPRRIELLSQLGIPFRVLPIDVAEHRDAGESSLDYVQRVALDKARAGLAGIDDDRREAWVLGADTEVVLEDAVFGKPADGEHAAEMLRRLSGRGHQVISAVALASATRTLHTVCISQVTLPPLRAEQIDAYVAQGEWAGKAGSYAIQGAAAAFIAHLSGSYSGVMGLPLFETAQLLWQAGLLGDIRPTNALNASLAATHRVEHVS